MITEFLCMTLMLLNIIIIHISIHMMYMMCLDPLSMLQPCTRSLRELNISYNRCGDNGLFMLKLGLLANRSLDKLNLCNVKMTDEGELGVVGSVQT